MLRLLLREHPLETVLKNALQALKDGGIIAYPTESFYALGVNAHNEDAIRRLYEVKKRPADKPAPLIAGSREILRTLVKSIPPQAEGLMKNFWPGALTMVFDAAEGLPDVLTAGIGKVAVRIPGESFALSLAKSADFPITATSANHSGSPPAETADEVIKYFGEEIDLIIDAGKTSGGEPSTIINVTVMPFKVLREGRVKVQNCRGRIQLLGL
ncbi:MAG: threonylcarbamoyl-AMP synthase [Nitrospirae bacterium]|nr:threonylcarbamoyl-AMP synthase [Nitrospirota bacterium]